MWTDDGLVYWRMYASLGLDTLNCYVIVRFWLRLLIPHCLNQQLYIQTHQK